MSQQSPSPATPGDPTDHQPRGDPWHAFGYIVSGVLVYGLAGWLADRWLGTTFLVAIGILTGAGFGIYMTYARFIKMPVPPSRRETDRSTQAFEQD